MNKNTIITILVIVIAVFAVSFIYKQNSHKDNLMDEVGHEVDEMSDEIKDRTN